MRISQREKESKEKSSDTITNTYQHKKLHKLIHSLEKWTKNDPFVIPPTGFQRGRVGIYIRVTDQNTMLENHNTLLQKLPFHYCWAPRENM